MRVELNEEDDGKKASIALKLWVEDPKKLKGKYKDTGAIEFTFDLVHEVPEVVAQEMVRKFFFSKSTVSQCFASSCFLLVSIKMLPRNKDLGLNPSSGRSLSV